MHTNGERLNDGEVIRRTIHIQQAIEAYKGEPFTFTMLQKQTGLPKGTLHRYLSIFVEKGILERHAYLRTYQQTREDIIRILAHLYPFAHEVAHP